MAYHHLSLALAVSERECREDVAVVEQDAVGMSEVIRAVQTFVRNHDFVEKAVETARGGKIARG